MRQSRRAEIHPWRWPRRMGFTPLAQEGWGESGSGVQHCVLPCSGQGSREHGSKRLGAEDGGHDDACALNVAALPQSGAAVTCYGNAEELSEADGVQGARRTYFRDISRR